MTVIGCNSLQRKILQMSVVDRFRIQATQGGYFCSRKRKGEAGMKRVKTAEGVPWIQWRNVARKEHKRERQRRKGEEDEGSEESRIRDQITEEVIARTQKKKEGCR